MPKGAQGDRARGPCAAQINQKYDVDGLCRALPKRLKMLEERKGDRISK